MRENFGKILIILAIGFLIPACGDDSKSDGNLNPVQIVETKKTRQESPAIPKPDYLFERHGYDCMQRECTFRKTSKKYRSAEFGKAIPNWVNLTQGMSKAGLREKIQKDFKGARSAEMGNTTSRNIMYDFVHLRPHLNIKTPEYEIYFTYGMDGKLQDWGGRVRCMPITPSTPWQTKPC